MRHTLEGGDRSPEVPQAVLGGVAGSWERVSMGRSSPSRSPVVLASCWKVVSSAAPPTRTSERVSPLWPPPLLSSSSSPANRCNDEHFSTLLRIHSAVVFMRSLGILSEFCRGVHAEYTYAPYGIENKL